MLWRGGGVVGGDVLIGLRGALANTGAARNAQAALEAVHAGCDAARGVVRGGQENARTQQLEVKLRRSSPGHLVERGVSDVRGAGELCGPELIGLIAQAIDLIGGHAVEDVGGGIRNRVDHDQVAEAFQEVLDKSTRVLAGLNHAIDGAEHRGGVAGGEGIHYVVEEGRVRVAEQGHREVVGHATVIGTGHELVQHGQRIANRAAAGTNHEGQDTGLRGHMFLLAQQLQVLHERLGRNQPERVVVGTRANGGEHLGRLGGREDELHVLRGLFHDFQECIEALARDHVRLINDEDLVAIPHRGESGAFAQVTGVIHAAV